MADLNAVVQTSEVALTVATERTVLQLTAPTNHRVKVQGWGVFFDSTNTSAEPVQVRVVRQTSAGTMTAATPYAIRPVAETIQSGASHSATVEPATTDVLDVIECHPQQGYEVKFPMGQEIIVGGGGRVAILCTAPAGVNVRAKLFFEE